ncbi:MAG: hypothetical protein Q9187_001199 [Circinaria calcarea]
MDPNQTTFMIPYGFATGDELRYSDAAAINSAICSGDRTPAEVVDYCLGRIKGKNGILRKQCNSTRPTNSMRFVASPLKGPRGTISLPNETFTKGKFLFLTEDGRFESTKIEEGDVVILGRCPSQGANSSLPMRVMRTTSNEHSMRVPLEVCKLNNTDFDGDEDWIYKPMTTDAIMETEEAFDRVWHKSSIVDISARLDRLVLEAGGDTSIDGAMYTTMPLEDMLDHPGGEIYDTLMLKPKSWKVMGATSFSPTYWNTWVERSLDGIVNSTMGKHGIGKPYVHMRNSMMMGTMVVVDKDHIRIRSSDPPPIPAVLAPPGMNQGTCSSALTKMTASLYQRGIDIAKHGKDPTRFTAVETLMKSTSNCFALTETNGSPRVVMMPVMEASQGTCPYTKMAYIANAYSPEDLLHRAVIVVSMVEELDDIKLTDEERLAAAIFFAFASRKVTEVISDDMVRIMRSMGGDWYTSITCSDIRWLKSELRKSAVDGSVNMTTDVSTILGSMALGNMSKFAPFASSRTRRRRAQGRGHDLIAN